MRIGHIQVSDSLLATLCAKWAVKSLSAFGSILREDFGPASDIDLLVEFDPRARWSLMDLVRAEEEFAALLGHRVQLVERNGLVRSLNHIRRNAILGSARLIHAA